MNEFALIDRLRECLGDRAAPDRFAVGPGDDCAVIEPTAGHQQVASIDALLEGVHFPPGAPPEAVGYRGMMVALSDLAAMGAQPRFVLIALSLEGRDQSWAEQLAVGVRRAAEVTDVLVAGGNIARGPRSITLSVHGEVPTDESVLRSGARIGDTVYVSGDLGAAAAAVRLGDFSLTSDLGRAYFEPRARFDLIDLLRSQASAAIDISDGLSQDVSHLAAASGVGVTLSSALIPIASSATLEDALYGGDDYELCFTAAKPPSFECIPVGQVISGAGVTLDGKPLHQAGYQHF